MILNQFPLTVITREIINTYYDKISETPPNENYHYQIVSLPSDDKKGLIYDIVSSSSLLFDKININDIIDFNVDISSFRENIGQLTLLNEKTNNKLSRYDTPLSMNIDTMASTSTYNHTRTEIEKFNVFIRLIGLPDLLLSHVYLLEEGNELIITMSEDNPVLIGTLRITTW